MRLFCRHCWKTVKIRTFKKAEHIQASCQECGEPVKNLNRKERRKLSIEEEAAQRQRESVPC